MTKKSEKKIKDLNIIADEIRQLRTKMQQLQIDSDRLMLSIKTINK